MGVPALRQGGFTHIPSSSKIRKEDFWRSDAHQEHLDFMVWCSWCGVIAGKLIPRKTLSAVTRNQSPDFCWKSYACECSDSDCVRASPMTAPCHPLIESFGQRVSSWVEAYPQRGGAVLLSSSQPRRRCEAVQYQLETCVCSFSVLIC